MTAYEMVIGLEVHAEMMTQSKMFCGCRVVDSVTADPNTAVCPVCLGMPGMLPVINKRAIEMAIRVGLALQCEIKPHNVFARKNYFYPDLAKAYQITQYELPIAENGYLDIELSSGESKRIRVRRVHMEEDTGKLTHLGGGESLVDYNRAGVPLLEIVSEPDMRSAEEAHAYALKLRQILRYLDVNSGDMEKGVIRFEANVSVRPAGSTLLGTRTEVKNLNSFKALTGSINYEHKRQSALVAEGGDVIQSTLGWNEAKQETFSQRGKEDAHDYRYFPEPDLPPLQLDPAWIVHLTDSLPELPADKRTRYVSTFELAADDAEQLIENQAVAQWFDAAVEAANQAGVTPKEVANWVLNNLFGLLNEHQVEIGEGGVKPAGLITLIQLVKQKTINHSTAKEVLTDMFVSGKEAKQIVADKGLSQISDEASIQAIIVKILDDNPDQVSNYLGGREKLRGWFVGQAMRVARGKADPGLLNKILTKELNMRR